MRKLLFGSTLILAALAMVAGGEALACGGAKKTGAVKTADASCGTGVKTADAQPAAASGCETKAAGAVQASAGTCGMKADGAQASGAACCPMGSAAQASLVSADGGSCHGKVSAALYTAAADPYLSGYLQVKGGMVSTCCPSTQGAAAAFHQQVKEWIASGKADEQKAEFEKLEAILAAWPAERAAQKDQFAKLTAWTIDYCKSFPERAAGAKVQADPASGKQWVQVSDETGNPYAG